MRLSCILDSVTTNPQSYVDHAPSATAAEAFVVLQYKYTLEPRGLKRWRTLCRGKGYWPKKNNRSPGTEWQKKPTCKPHLTFKTGCFFSSNTYFRFSISLENGEFPIGVVGELWDRISVFAPHPSMGLWEGASEQEMKESLKRLS